MYPRLLLSIGLLVVLAGFARADEDAKTVFERGTALFALHRFLDAAAAYEKAFELRPDPAILYNAAQAHRLAGNKTRALELYESLLTLYGDKVPKGAEVKDHIVALRRAIDADRHVATAPSHTPLPSASATTVEPQVRSKPALTPPPEPAASPAAANENLSVRPVPAHQEPITKRRWFWGVVAGGAAVVIAGVTVGIVLGTSKTVPPMPTIGTAQGN